MAWVITGYQINGNWGAEIYLYWFFFFSYTFLSLANGQCARMEHALAFDF